MALLIAIFCLIVIVFVYMDLRRRYTRQIEDLTKKCNKAEDNKNLLLTTLSREIRNSMIMVMGMDELILRPASILKVKATVRETDTTDIFHVLRGTV